MEKIAPEKPAMRVFLVEDNPEHVFVALTVITQVLGESTEIVVAENAEEAISLLPQFTEFDRPDLILVDLRLPNNGGFAVLSAIQEHQATTDVPTMVVTSSL